MRKIILAGVSAAARIALPVAANAAAPAAPAAAKASAVKPHKAAPHNKNALLNARTGPYGGYPRIDKVKVSDFKPALEEAMALNRAEINAIANNPAKPTFANTFEALERSGQPLARVQMIFGGIWAANLSTPEYQKVQDENCFFFFFVVVVV